MGNIYTSTTFMEHNSHPDYKYEMDSPTHSHDGINPSCGDELTLQLRIENDVIEEASFIGHGCAISQASADIMADLITGETVEEAARRELKEETGLDLVEITHELPPAYSAVGLSNEQCICVFGVAEGEIAPCKETGEEITARWYTKAELRDMLRRGETFGSWAQAYSFMWSIGL